jgi:hypothetical protein
LLLLLNPWFKLGIFYWNNFDWNGLDDAGEDGESTHWSIFLPPLDGKDG